MSEMVFPDDWFDVAVSLPFPEGYVRRGVIVSQTFNIELLVSK